MNFFRNLAKSLREERLRAHYRWMRRNKVILPKPKPDERSSIDLHNRILARQ